MAVRQLKAQVAALEAEGKAKEMLAKFRDRLTVELKRRRNMEDVLLDPGMLRHCVQYVGSLSEWMMLQAQPGAER